MSGHEDVTAHASCVAARILDHLAVVRQRAWIDEGDGAAQLRHRLDGLADRRGERLAAIGGCDLDAERHRVAGAVATDDDEPVALPSSHQRTKAKHAYLVSVQWQGYAEPSWVPLLSVEDTSIFQLWHPQRPLLRL